VVNEVYRVIVGKPRHPEQFPYIDCWWDAVLSWPSWLRPYLEEACRIMVARVATASKCREKAKEPILAEEPEEVPPPYRPLYPPLPPVPSSAPLPLTVEGETQGTVTPVKSCSEASGASTPLTSLSPMDSIHILSSPVLTPHSPLNREHLTSLQEDPPPPQTPAALQMPLREAQSSVNYDQEGQIPGGEWVFVYQPFTTTDLLNWKHHTPSFMEKPQALIDLRQSIIQTHKPTWTDCRQLLLTLFNTEEQRRVTLAASKWLEDHAPEDTLNAQAYIRPIFPNKTPIGTPIIAEVTSNLNGIRRHY
jgi:hypothetical protein